MDHFGIGQAMRGMAGMFFASGRRTGRTTSLVESLKDGDRVIFSTQNEATRVARLIQRRDINVECIVIPPSQPDRIFERGTSKGRTIFDHQWVEQYYNAAIDRAGSDIDHFQKNASGFGAAHLETRHAAEQHVKWRSYQFPIEESKA